MRRRRREELTGVRFRAVVEAAIGRVVLVALHARCAPVDFKRVLLRC